MKDANYQGFWRLLGLMHDAGALPHVLIIGSWAEYLYAQSGLLPGYVANLRTLDIDFLIRNQRKPRTMVNLPTAMREAGYVMMEDILTGTTKTFSPDGLEVEFLIAQLGSGEQAVLPTHLGVKAQALSHLGMLRDHVRALSVLGLEVHVPSPEAYVLHKCVINAQRKQKGEKDRQSILALLPHLEISSLKEVWRTLSRKQQRAAADVLLLLGEAARPIVLELAIGTAT